LFGLTKSTVDLAQSNEEIGFALESSLCEPILLCQAVRTPRSAQPLLEELRA
jgi:hypothetical protein